MARQEITSPGMHPVYWCFNLRQKNVGTPIPLFCLNYHEFCFVIPYVYNTFEKHQQGAYSPALYLNSPLGVAGGKLIWQLNKMWKRCTVTPESFNANSTKMTVKRLLHSEKMLHASFEKTGEPLPYQNSKNFMMIKPMLDQPLLSNGPWGDKSSDFIIDYEQLKIQPLMSSIQTMDFLDGFKNMNRTIPSIENSVLGGFYFNIDWQLILPKG